VDYAIEHAMKMCLLPTSEIPRGTVSIEKSDTAPPIELHFALAHNALHPPRFDQNMVYKYYWRAPTQKYVPKPLEDCG